MPDADPSPFPVGKAVERVARKYASLPKRNR